MKVLLHLYILCYRELFLYMAHLNLTTTQWYRRGLYYHYHFQVKGEMGRVKISQSVIRSKDSSQLGRLRIYLLYNHLMYELMKWWLADST